MLALRTMRILAAKMLSYVCLPNPYVRPRNVDCGAKLYSREITTYRNSSSATPLPVPLFCLNYFWYHHWTLCVNAVADTIDVRFFQSAVFPDRLTDNRKLLSLGGENVRPTALVLHLRTVWSALDNVLNFEPGCFDPLCDCRWLKEKEIHRNRLS